ncbi:MAG: hypothetical protein BGO98_05835 [Myxococcales bacterium 68-20]|nr:Mov34/MPN/PAD-1 family protein [Myxococcales bacterium]OJY28590.1 MAG: hypothetical protein BGO98_05835 [Myxococcales bacterium 68-20]
MSHRLLREVFVLLGEDGRILWSDASESPVRLPDSRARWEAIWALRGRIVEIAHSHPIGPLAFSREDATTMRALVSALGRPLLFSIVAPGGMLRRVESIDGGEAPPARVVEDEPHWTNALRLASGMQAARDKSGRAKDLVFPETEK